MGLTLMFRIKHTVLDWLEYVLCWTLDMIESGMWWRPAAVVMVPLLALLAWWIA